MRDFVKAKKLDEEIKNKRVEIIQAPTEEERLAKKAELKYLEKQRKQAYGLNEYSSLLEVRNMDTNEGKHIVENYNNLKEKMSQINKLNVATRRMVITGISKSEEQGKTYKKGAA